MSRYWYNIVNARRYSCSIKQNTTQPKIWERIRFSALSSHSSVNNSSKENFSGLSLAIPEKNFLIATDQANNQSFWPKIQFKNVLKLAVFAKLTHNNFLAEPFSGITSTRKQEGFSVNKMRPCPLHLIKYFRKYYWISKVYLRFWAISRPPFLEKSQKLAWKTTRNLILGVPQVNNGQIDCS